MKKKLVKILLFMLPFMALVLATTNNSVQLIDMVSGDRTAGSYFVLLSESPVAICPPFAAFCSIFSCVAAVIYLFSRRKGFLKTAAWLSFAGACLAVVPVTMRGETLMLPNVFFPILLLSHFLLCAFSKKLNLSEKEEPQGRRLEQH